jgi:hypothetical protein
VSPPGAQVECVQFVLHVAVPQIGAAAPHAPFSQQRMVPLPSDVTATQAPWPAHLMSHAVPKQLIGPHCAPAAQLMLH